MYILILVDECQGPFFSLARAKMLQHYYIYFTVTQDSAYVTKQTWPEL